MGGEEASEHYDVCMGANLTCMNDMMNRMGQFDHVDYNGVQVKCRSNCEDQINSLFVTTSSYPNRKTLVYREEFCILAKGLIEKCDGPKKKPLEREYPNICAILAPLRTLKPGTFCINNQWSLPRGQIPNCTRRSCPIEDAILRYARENLVMFNIFIKDPYAKRFQKDEKITKTSYIANSGGLLGLCMGFSLISAAEILFHCFFGMVSAIFPSQKKPGYTGNDRWWKQGNDTDGHGTVNEYTADTYQDNTGEYANHCDVHHHRGHYTNSSLPQYDDVAGLELEENGECTVHRQCCHDCCRRKQNKSIVMNPTSDFFLAQQPFGQRHHDDSDVGAESDTFDDELKCHRLRPCVVHSNVQQCSSSSNNSVRTAYSADNHRQRQPVVVVKNKTNSLDNVVASGVKTMVVRARNNATCQTVLGNGKAISAAAGVATSTTTTAAGGGGYQQGGGATLSSLSASSVSSTAAAITANHKPGYINIGPERII